MTAIDYVPYISIILPVHNEEKRLPGCLDDLTSFLWSRSYRYEIIAVDNGSTDGTAAILREHARTFMHFIPMYIPQRGKGAAVRAGMLMAKGRYRFMADVDLSTPPKEIDHFLEAARQYDLVIGSRELDRSRVTTTPKRQMIGRVWHWLVSDLVPGIRDTQCGFKMFRDTAAEDLFGAATIDGMAFDVELLYLAKLKGYSIREMPVEWHNDADSRVRLVGDSLQMFADALSVPWRHAALGRVSARI